MVLREAVGCDKMADAMFQQTKPRGMGLTCRVNRHSSAYDYHHLWGPPVEQFGNLIQFCRKVRHSDRVAPFFEWLRLSTHWSDDRVPVRSTYGKFNRAKQSMALMLFTSTQIIACCTTDSV